MTSLAFTIASIEVFCIRVPVKMPIKVAFGTFRDRPMVLLRVTSTDGAEGTAGSFNASLRDYGRFGLLLAHDGQRGEHSIIPRTYVLEATDAQKQPPAFRPRVATPFMGYGYQTWLLPYKTRTFALQGIHGQTIYVQPDSKIVMVQTAVHTAASGRQDARPYQYRQALWEGVLKSLGGQVD